MITIYLANWQWNSLDSADRPEQAIFVPDVSEPSIFTINSGPSGDFFQTGPVIPMPVPSSYNDVTQDKRLRDFVGWAWYETQAYISPLWKMQRVVLRFDSVHYFANVVSYFLTFFKF